jgi:HAD superfamily hydrolase (TIGR01490 family)
MSRQHHLTPQPVALATTTSRLAIFDLDRTLIPGSSLAHLARVAVRQGLLPPRRAVAAGAREALFRFQGASPSQLERIGTRAARAAAGMELAALLPAIEVAADEIVDQMSAGAHYLVDEQLAAGSFCVILSASPQELVEAVSLRLGTHRGVGTRVQHAAGHLTGEIDGSLCYGLAKIGRLVSSLGRIDLRDAAAYADSISDLPLLTAVGRPVAVNPDRELLGHAEEHGWPVLRLG